MLTDRNSGLKKFFIFEISAGIFFAVHSLTAGAAPCCGGGGQIPALITNDDRAQLSARLMILDVVGDAPGAGQGVPVFRTDASGSEQRTVVSLEGAWVVDDDRLQIGGILPVQYNHVAQTRSGANSTAVGFGLGDPSFSVGYEAVQEFESDTWVPRVWIYGQMVAPLGRSVYESTTTLGSDVTGVGQWQTHGGIVATKIISSWDFQVAARAGALWARGFEQNSSAIFTALGPASVWQGGLSAGYRIASLRMGLGVDTRYQSVQQVSQVSTGGTLISAQASQRWVWTTALSLAWSVTAEWSVGVTYLDQTLLGPAINTSLSRGISLGSSWAWGR